MIKTFLIISIFFLMLGLTYSSGKGFYVFSNSFKENSPIPLKFTCQGNDISPEISWGNIPKGTKSFALVMEDPDAPFGTFVHWVIYNIPGDYVGLKENVKKEEHIENGIAQGINDFGKTGYGGPCPPPGRAHRYFIKLYALDENLNLPAGLRANELMEKIKGHILSKTTYFGLYQRR